MIYASFGNRDRAPLPTSTSLKGQSFTETPSTSSRSNRSVRDNKCLANTCYQGPPPAAIQWPLHAVQAIKAKHKSPQS